MENKKIRLGILFGGKSAEHEVSLISAKMVIESLDPEKYDVVLIGIEKTGEWRLRDTRDYLMHADNPKMIQLNQAKKDLALVPTKEKKELIGFCGNQLQESLSLDVILPMLHGTYGEDGTVQGLLKLANIPFVGAGVLGSAVGMDKDVMKRLLRDGKIPTANFITLYDHHSQQPSFESIVEKLGLPFFVKPANLGSSVGITKVKRKEEFDKAIADAFLYDRKILVEEFIRGREIVCSVLGNEEPVVSLPGEIIPKGEFYSYEAKYIVDDGAEYKVPVDLPSDMVEKVQQISSDSYRVLCCEGMARVDLFLNEQGEFLVNEINTIPGFTRNSLYPKLWKASGLSCTKLLDRLVELAIDRHRKEARLKTTF
jgi:D-alanine-D-alanine ligase